MASAAGFNILFWLLLWGALIRVVEIRWHDSDSAVGKLARALAVVY